MRLQSAYKAAMPGLLRHIQACNNAALPGGRLRLLVCGQVIGWVAPDLTGRLAELGAARVGDAVSVPPEQLQKLARRLAAEGAFPWRHEAFDVRAVPDGPVLAQLDRGALPSFGVQAVGVHVNGLVERDGRTSLWVARRASNRLLDPGKLDHLAAGGVPAGLTPAETLVKEAEEEAGVPPALSRLARHVGTITYAMERPEGLRRDLLHCYDLLLPESFTPLPRDSEVERFELWPLEQALERVRETNDFKFNVNLVLIDLFLRRGLVEPGDATTLRQALDRSRTASPSPAGGLGGHSAPRPG